MQQPPTTKRATEPLLAGVWLTDRSIDQWMVEARALARLRLLFWIPWLTDSTTCSFRSTASRSLLED